MDTISLNVGGVHFETTADTLRMSVYFSSFLDNWTCREKLFIDRSGKIFEHVLILLRNPNYIFPSKYKDELDFYGIVHDKFTDELTNNVIAKIDQVMVKVARIEFFVELNNERIKSICITCREYSKFCSDCFMCKCCCSCDKP